jgi:hypothetical protein
VAAPGVLLGDRLSGALPGESASRFARGVQWQDLSLPFIGAWAFQPVLLLRWLKTPNSMGKMGTAEVLRLRAISAVSSGQCVRRFAQDDDSVGPRVPLNRLDTAYAIVRRRSRVKLSRHDFRFGLAGCSQQFF